MILLDWLFICAGAICVVAAVGYGAYFFYKLSISDDTSYTIYDERDKK